MHAPASALLSIDLAVHKHTARVQMHVYVLVYHSFQLSASLRSYCRFKLLILITRGLSYFFSRCIGSEFIAEVCFVLFCLARPFVVSSDSLGQVILVSLDSYSSCPYWQGL